MADQPQTQAELLKSLRRHTRVLEENAQRAFDQPDLDFVPEVASKLRVLTYRTRTNQPLLLDLMDELNLDVRLKFTGPGATEQEQTLEEYLETRSGAQRTPSGQLVEFTPRRLVALIANKLGTHEDWELPESLIAAFDSQFQVGGLPVALKELQCVTNNVIHVAKKVLRQTNT